SLISYSYTSRNKSPVVNQALKLTKYACTPNLTCQFSIGPLFLLLVSRRFSIAPIALILLSYCQIAGQEPYLVLPPGAYVSRMATGSGRTPAHLNSARQTRN